MNRRMKVAMLLLGASLVASVQAQGIGGLVGATLRLEAIEPAGGPRLVPRDPARYTLTLSADGGVEVVADCNRGLGSYATEGIRIEFDLAFTRAACPPGSLFGPFTEALTGAVSYALRNGRLVIGYGVGDGVMVLAPSGGTRPVGPVGPEGPALATSSYLLAPVEGSGVGGNLQLTETAAGGTRLTLTLNGIRLGVAYTAALFGGDCGPDRQAVALELAAVGSFEEDPFISLTVVDQPIAAFTGSDLFVMVFAVEAGDAVVACGEVGDGKGIDPALAGPSSQSSQLASQSYGLFAVAGSGGERGGAGRRNQRRRFAPDGDAVGHRGRGRLPTGSVPGRLRTRPAAGVRTGARRRYPRGTVHQRDRGGGAAGEPVWRRLLSVRPRGREARRGGGLR